METNEFYVEILKPFMERDMRLAVRLNSLVSEMAWVGDATAIGAGKFAKDIMQDINASPETVETVRRMAVAWAVSKRKPKRKKFRS